MLMLPDDQTLTPLAYNDFFDQRRAGFLKNVRAELEQCLERNLNPQRNYQLDDWKKAICALPALSGEKGGDWRPRCRGAVIVLGAEKHVLEDGAGTGAGAVGDNLRRLMPWRKGPFRIFGVDVDSEWRSNWKWERVAPYIQPLAGRRVLDVGCGNGYYLWRMLDAGAEAVVGIEPHLLNVAQFAVMQRYAQGLPLTVLPMQLEEHPTNSRLYDTVFSMGVLYHRKSPAEHILLCKSCLREGGELVLETLVVEGDANTVLLPGERYAKMRNVWHIPSVDHLIRLLQRCGFKNPRLVNLNRTSPEEQRRTSWMNFESLEDFLDPADPGRTVEGHPAPLRAIILAEAP